jgi:hypothetical protein
MSTNVTTVKRPVVSLKLPASVPAFIAMAKHVIDALTTNAATFPNPDPPVATLSTAVCADSRADRAVLARQRGAVIGRKDKRKALATLLEQEKGYIQKVADAGTPDAAGKVIESAGVAVRKPVLRQKQVFSVKEGAVSGTVKLTNAAAGHRASYDWQFSVDGGKTWQAAPSTLQSKTSMPGLPAGQTVLFRGRSLTKTGDGDWTQPVALQVR